MFIDLNVFLSNFDNDTILHIYAYIQSFFQVSIATIVSFTFPLAFAWVMVTIVLVASVIGYSDKYDKLQMNINNYYTASQNINRFSFDELKNGDIRLNNGKLMKIQRTQVHPDDLLISYENINIEVENNNGQAETVTLFDKCEFAWQRLFI